MDRDLIEGVVLLPENLFYNTTAPGVLLFVNRAKPAKRRGRIMLINASGEFAKGKPKNYVTDAGIKRIADTFLKWKEVEKFSRVVSTDEAKANDYNLSPSRYIDLGDARSHRDISEILSDLDQTRSESAAIDATMNAILSKLGLRTESVRK